MVIAIKKLRDIYKQDLESVIRQRTAIAIKIANNANTNLEDKMTFSKLDGMCHYLEDFILRIERIIKEHE